MPEQTVLRKQAYPNAEVAKRASLTRGVANMKLSVKRCKATLPARIKVAEKEIIFFEKELVAAEKRLAAFEKTTANG